MVRIQPKITVLRAISSVVARRALFAITIVAAIVFAVLLAIIVALAYFFSSWWWLLLVIYIPLLLIVAIVLLVAYFIASKLYSPRLTLDQKRHIQEFTDKLLRLIETRGLGWWWFAALCVRDLLFYRELRTLKGIISDATSLKNDFASLERELG